MKKCVGEERHFLDRNVDQGAGWAKKRFHTSEIHSTKSVLCIDICLIAGSREN